jgi:hypothetical protein
MADETAGSGENVPEQIRIAWDARIRILVNPSVWGGVLAAFGIGSFLLTVLFLAISKSPRALVAGAGIFAFLMVVFVIVGLCIDLFGGFRTTFALTTLGVRSIAGKGAGRAADAAFWAGLLLGNPGAAGAGLLARSEQNVFIRYGDVTRVKLKPGRRYLLVKGGFTQKPIGLYCTQENYDQVEAILRRQCPATAFS